MGDKMMGEQKGSVLTFDTLRRFFASILPRWAPSRFEQLEMRRNWDGGTAAVPALPDFGDCRTGSYTVQRFACRAEHTALREIFASNVANLPPRFTASARRYKSVICLGP